MEILSLPPTGFKVLQALNEFRFLSINQMLRLGVAKDRGNLSKVLGSMVSAKKDKAGIPLPKEIGMLDFGVIAGIGRLSRLYFLAPKGAEALAEADRDGPPARPVLHAVRFQADYFHRVHTVDFHITLAEFAAAAGHELPLVRQYFNRLPKDGKSPARPSTSIDLKPGFIDPDSIYMLRDPAKDIDRLLLVEIANGHKVDRVVKKLPRYAQAIENRKVNDAFNYGNKSPRVLWLFEHKRTLELVQRRLETDRWTQALAPHFFFRTLADCTTETFVEGWQGAQPEASARRLF